MTTLSIRSQSSDSLNLSGSGTLHETGFNDAPGTFSFSGLSSKGASPQATFSWSASDQATVPIPEPMTIGLLCVGVIGLGLVRRRTASRTAPIDCQPKETTGG
jgi:hypothetical protein